MAQLKVFEIIHSQNSLDFEVKDLNLKLLTPGNLMTGVLLALPTKSVLLSRTP